MGQWGLLVLAGGASAALHPGESPLDDPATRLGDKPPLSLIPPTIWIVNRRILLTACTTLPV
jgi:hypothetical protein